MPLLEGLSLLGRSSWSLTAIPNGAGHQVAERLDSADHEGTWIVQGESSDQIRDDWGQQQ